MKKILTSHKKLLLPIIIAMVICFGIGLTACAAFGIEEQHIIDNGFTCLITFDYMGGSESGASQKTIRLKENSKIPDLVTSGKATPRKTDHSFRYFCVAQTDEEGKVVLDEDGNAIPSDVIWDFKNDRVQEDTYLCAIWWQNYKLDLHYGDDVKTVMVARNYDGSAKVLGQTEVLIDGFSIIDYYNDPEFTDVLSSPPIRFTDELFGGDDGLTYDVYCKGLVGDYVVIKKPTDFSSISFGTDTNIYLCNNIDMSEGEDSLPVLTFPAEYGGHFIGNGYSFSNFALKMSTSSDSRDVYFGIFKRLLSGAHVEDVTFDNVKLDISLDNALLDEYTIALFAGQVDNGAVVDSVLANGTIDYTLENGCTEDKIDFNSFVGDTVPGASVSSNSGTTDLHYVHSKPIYVQISENDYYAVYVKYTVENDTATVIDIYLLSNCIRDPDTDTYSSFKQIRGDFSKGDNGVYTLTTNRKGNFDITVNVVGTLITATVVSVAQ